ncbi:PREDICTED: uncharacterized protein LOC101314781 [Fragaria vesca subsp. vesca]
MSDMQELEFAKLDINDNGMEYLRWVTDIEIALTAHGITATIQGLNPDHLAKLSTAKKAQALSLMRRHMDTSLPWEYMSIKDPRELRVALEAHFGNIQDTILPDLKEKWNDLRFLDFKTVAEYNSEALCLKSMLQLCGETVTERDLIEKTLSSFPIAASVLSQLYLLEYNFQRITQFHQLINLMLVAEKHDNVFVNSYNSRPVGTKKVYTKGERKEQNPRAKGNLKGRFGPYNRPTNKRKSQ